MRYVEEKPYDAMAHLVLGYNLKFSGKPKDAAKAFQRVLEIDPASRAARLFLDALTAPPAKAAPPKEAPPKEAPPKEAKDEAAVAPAAPVEQPAPATPAERR
jgi:hypothetical protein